MSRLNFSDVNYVLCFLIALSVSSLFTPFCLEYTHFVIRPFDLMLFFCLILIFAKYVLSNKLVILKDSLFCIFCMLAIWLFLTGIWNGVGYHDIIKEIVQTMQFMVFVFIVAFATKRQIYRQYFVKWLIVFIIIIAGVALVWHFFNGHYVGFKQLNEPKLSFSFLAAMIFPIFIVKYMYFNIFSKKYFAITLISFTLMIASLERKGWLAFGGAAIFSFLALEKVKPLINKEKLNIKWFKIIAVSLTVLCICTFLLFTNNALKKQALSVVNAVHQVTVNPTWEEGQTRSNQARIYLWQFSWNKFKENPFSGIGVEQFKTEIEKHAPKNFLVHGPHNEYARYLVETGFIGLFMYLLIYVSLIKKLIVLHKKGNIFDSYFLVTISLLFYGMIVNLFLGGGALNYLFLSLPAGLILGFKWENTKKIFCE